MYDVSPRLHLPFEQDWRFHLGEIGHIPRLSQKAAGIAGLADLLKDERPKTRQANPWEEMFEKLSSLPAFAALGGSPAPADRETGWSSVRLPHDWKTHLPYTNDVQTYSPTLVTQGYKPSGVGYYRKLFHVPSEWDGRQIAIEFDGIMGASAVWVNGVCLGEHWSGYTSFAYDLTEILNYGAEGENVILIRVDCTDAQGWWYEGAGIYRHVWLTVTDRLRVAQWGTFIATPQIAPNEAAVRVQTTVENGHATAQRGALKTTLLDPDGRAVAEATQAIEAPGLGRETASQELRIAGPRLWSPETPTLYLAVTEIIQDDQVVDRYTTTFGIREVAYTRDGLFINGRHTVIQGVCVHQDFAGVGIAMPDRVIEYRLQRLKECGCNAYRSAHHPPTPELLDSCDRLGILVLDENRLLESTQAGLAELESMMRRDRNHPSVFMWSLSNEESVAGTPKGRRLYRTMVDHARKLDPTRPLTSATAGGKDDAAYIDIADVAGYNYAPSTRQYGLARKHFELYPQRRFLGTEDACYFTTRGIYADDPARGWCSSYGSSATLLGPAHPAEGIDLSQYMDIGALAAPEATWKHYLENPFMGGVFIWTGYDYRGEPFPWAWPQIMHQGGIYDLCGFEKDYTYFIKAIWNETPIVHLMPHWDWPEKAGQEVAVRVYTNCDEVELLVNGQSLGRRPPDNIAQVNWRVIYAPGAIEAHGYRNGQRVAVDRRETTGAPAALRVSPDRNRIRADGADLALVTVEVLDEAGRLSPTACPELKFALRGPAVLLGLGSGDPACHEPEHGDRHTAFNGLCLAIVQSTSAAGQATLEVSAPGLSPGRAVIELV
jgi:beta-galactosidase